jgi:site-specific DNA recombinase
MIAKSRRPREAKKGPTNVALYLRVSTDKQAQKEDGSLDTQTDLLKEFVESKRRQGFDWLVVERVVEGEKDGKRHGKSAKNTDRPGLKKILDLARAGLIDVVVFTKLDRISRSVVDFLLLVEELHRYGVELASLRDLFDFTTPHGRMYVTLMIAFAQCEREIISGRVREKVAWRAEKGFPLGPPPLGYRMKEKMYEIDEPFASHVRAADQLYLDHESSDRVTLEFRKRGFRTPSGAFYTKAMICRMLRNEVYAAKLSHRDALHDGQWKAIRSWDTHLRIQKVMDRNGEQNRSSKRQPDDYVYLLQGLLRCGICGHKMSPKPGTGRNGAYYPYYSCVGAEKSVGGACPRRYVPSEALDRAVLAFLKELVLKPERLRAFAAGARELESSTLGKLREDLERTRERLGSVRSKLSRLADAVADGGASVLATLKEKMESLQGEREELEAIEARLKADLAGKQVEAISADQALDSLNLFHDLVEKCEKNPERLKILIPRFVDYVVWHAEVKGEGRLEVGLFQEPIAEAAEVRVGAGGCSPGPSFVGGYQMVRREGLEPTTR